MRAEENRYGNGRSRNRRDRSLHDAGQDTAATSGPATTSPGKSGPAKTSLVTNEYDDTPANSAVTARPPRWMWRWTIGAIALWWVGVLAANAVRALHDIILIALVSFLVACALEAPVTRLERRGLRRGFATMIVLIGLLAMMIATSVAGGALLVTQVSSLTDALPDLARSFIGFANSFGVHLSADVPVENFATRIEELLRANAGNLLVKGSLLVGQIAAGALLVFYFVADGPRMRRNVCSVLPPARQQMILDIWTAAIDKAGGYLVVRVVLAFAASAASWVFFTVAGVDYAIALALWVGIVSQIVPAVGTYLAALLPLLVAASEGTGVTVAVLVFLVTYQQVENYLLAPRIARKVMQVHPAIGFFAAISGAVVAGAPGALIAVPVIATAQAVIAASVERHQLVENELLTNPPARTTRRNRTSLNLTSRTINARALTKNLRGGAQARKTTPKTPGTAKNTGTTKNKGTTKNTGTSKNTGTTRRSTDGRQNLHGARRTPRKKR